MISLARLLTTHSNITRVINPLPNFQTTFLSPLPNQFLLLVDFFPSKGWKSLAIYRTSRFIAVVNFGKGIDEG